MKPQKGDIEYFEQLQRSIAAMSRHDRKCAVSLVMLGQVLAELITQSDWRTVGEMSAVCRDLFEQAERVRHEESKGRLN